jgi:hypothetical protein
MTVSMPKIKSSHRGWIGVDLDGTLAFYEGGLPFNPTKIGAPIPMMVERVKQHLRENIHDVRILTARVFVDEPHNYPNHDAWARAAAQSDQIRAVIKAWCKQHIGQELPVTCCKDYEMVALYDDRAFRIVPNTGELCCDYGLEKQGDGLSHVTMPKYTQP